MEQESSRVGKDPINIGIIGLGRATALMLPAFESFPLVRVIAGADPRAVARTAFRDTFGGTPYRTPAELCADRDVDAVVIATPPEHHAEHTVAAAEAGKHVLVEKPMAPTIADCDRMIAAAERGGVQLLVGHTLAYSPAVRAIAHSVATEEFGRMGSVLSLYYTDYLYRPRRDGELVPAPGAGIVLNQLPHLIDCIRLISGGVIEEVVGAAAWSWDEARPVPGAASAFLRLGPQATASIIYSGYDRFDSTEWTFGIDELGQAVEREPGATRLRLHDVAMNQSEAHLLESTRFGGEAPPGGLSPRTSARQPQCGVLLVSCEAADLRPSPDGLFIYADRGVFERRIDQAYWPAGRTEVLQALYDAVAGGVPSVHDGHWGKATVEVCLAIEAAARSGSPAGLVGQRRPAVAVKPPLFVD